MNSTRPLGCLGLLIFLSPISAQDFEQPNKGIELPAMFANRTGANREAALRDFGGTAKSEQAVERGLKWLIRQQNVDGRWMVNSPNLADKDRGSEANDIAGTALSLLPLLGAGHTHKPGRNNPFDKNIDKGLKFLVKSQDKKTGYFGVSMYAHGLATMALCEAYGLTNDPALKAPAQMALDLLISIQNDKGGWRYTPMKHDADLSVSGFQMMALKAGHNAGLSVPVKTIRGVKILLDACGNNDEGYAYTPGQGSTPRMSAVGLLCRQQFENWGPTHPRMLKGVKGFILPNAPDRQDVYYCYYATQLMFQFGGKEWKNWNEKVRDTLIEKQDSDDKKATFGSWSPHGDPWGKAGGRLMMTSLNLLTLEVYYRYVPSFKREAEEK